MVSNPSEIGDGDSEHLVAEGLESGGLHIEERKAPAPEVKEPELPPHLEQTWEELRELVWSMPMIRAARTVGLSDQGLRKKCYRLDIPLPPQGYWSTPPERREKFMVRAYRSHHGLARGE